MKDSYASVSEALAALATTPLISRKKPFPGKGLDKLAPWSYNEMKAVQNI